MKGEDSMPAAGRMTNLHSSDYISVVSESRATTKPSLAPHARLPVKPAANMSVADDGPSLDVVLARLLGVAIERAAALLDDYDAIAPLARVEVAELRTRYGLTARQVTRLKDALTLTLRLLYGSGRERPQIRSSRDVTDLMRPRLGGLPHEEVWVLLLDTKNRVVAEIQLYVGTIDSCQVRVAELFRKAIRRNARNVILVHNHPAGSADPSPEDVALTREAVRAGLLLDIAVLDHVVVGRQAHTSLKERGLGWGD